MTPIRIAKLVRKAVELWVLDNDDINEDTLLGACGIASYTLWEALRAFGYRPTLMVDDDGNRAHCWVELNDEFIDITATQFGEEYPDVYRGHVATYPLGLSDNPETGREALKILEDWDDQGPGPYRKRIKSFVRALLNSHQYRTVQGGVAQRDSYAESRSGEAY